LLAKDFEQIRQIGLPACDEVLEEVACCTAWVRLSVVCEREVLSPEATRDTGLLGGADTSWGMGEGGVGVTKLDDLLYKAS
jgi:hypothetical protein